MEKKTKVTLTEKELDLLLRLVLVEGNSYRKIDNWRVNYQRAFVYGLHKKLSDARKSR